MISKSTLMDVGAIALIAVAISFASHMNGKIRTERDNYKRSVNALLDKVETQRIDSARTAYTISQVTLERDEFKKRNEEDAMIIKELNSRLKDVKTVSKAEVIAETPISLPFENQLLEADPIQLFDVDQYKSVGLRITKDSIVGSVRMVANLTQYVYAEYKHRFLWWRWGLKGIRQTIISDNPNITIGYAEYYSLEK